MSAQALTLPEDPPAFERLRARLRPGETPRLRDEARHQAEGVRRALYDPEFEKSALAHWVPLRTRLAKLAALQDGVLVARLSSRDREDIAREIDRLAMRLLRNSGMIDKLLAFEAPAAVKAAALLELAGRHAVPRGQCTRYVLDAARKLLRDPRVQTELTAQTRQELLERLAEAERVQQRRARLAAWPL